MIFSLSFTIRKFESDTNTKIPEILSHTKYNMGYISLWENKFKQIQITDAFKNHSKLSIYLSKFEDLNNNTRKRLTT